MFGKVVRQEKIITAVFFFEEIMRGLPLLYIFIYDLKKGVTKYWKIEKNRTKKRSTVAKSSVAMIQFRGDMPSLRCA